MSPYRVAIPADEVNPPGIDAGPLLIGDRDRATALKSLTESLGVDLAKPGYGYALVCLHRLVGTVSHSCLAGAVIPVPDPVRPDPRLGVDPGFRSALTKLRPGVVEDGGDQVGSISVPEVSGYLALWEKYGTHFVSKITVGDIIFQVFAYAQDKFRRLQAAYAKEANPLSGAGAISFQYFTTDAGAGAFGYVSDFGKVLSMIGSPAILASVSAGDWKEPLWSGRDSIFEVYQSRSKVGPERLDREFTENGAAGVELLSLAPFAEFQRRHHWRSIFKAALFQKYPGGVRPNFGKTDPRDFQAMLPEYDEGFLSTIATPNINTYKSRLDLSGLQFVAADEVKNLTVLGNVLQNVGPSKAEIPGARVALVAQVFDMQRSSGNPPELRLTEAGFDNLVVSCREFLGAARLVNPDGARWKTISDGVVYETGGLDANQRSVVAATRDVRTPPDPSTLTMLQSSLEFSLAFAQAVAANQCCPTLSPVTALMRDYLMWFGDLIPRDTADVALSSMRLRAVEMARVLTQPSPTTFVPLLRAADYEKQVESILGYLDAINRQIKDYQDQIAFRKQAELLVDVGRTLNKNIVESGQLLTKVVEANAAQQQDLANFYDGVIAYQKSELEKQRLAIARIEADLANSRSDVKVAVEAYKGAVKQWQTMQAIKFGLELATGLFELGTAFLIPASAIDSVKELGLAAQRIQKFLTVVNAVEKVYSGAQASIGDLQGANETVDGLEGVIGSVGTLGWDQMEAQMKDVLASGPSDPELAGVTSKVETSFGLLVLTGKSLISAQAVAHSLAREIYLNQQQTAINHRQTDRLDDLKGFLNPASIDQLDRDRIDLIGLTGGLASLRDQMMGMLARSFLLQDQALQYEWLQPPTAISSFNLLRFRGDIVRQATATSVAKTALNGLQATETTPIEFTIRDVPVEQITDGKACEFVVDLQNEEFQQYVDARVTAATVAVDGIESTDSGIYHVNLEFPGELFYDRDPDRRPLAFRTPGRQRTYEYKVEGNVPEFVDGGKSWSDDVNPVTPFGTWKVRLPKTQKNKGLKLKGVTTDVRLSFSLKARVRDAPAPRSTGVGGAPLAGPTPGPQAEILVSTMNKQGSALNGWDVVFNLSLPQINKALREQYDQFKADPNFKNVIDVTTRISYPGDVVIETHFFMQYGYPSLQFPVDQPQNVALEMAILGGSYLNTTTYVDGTKAGEKKKELGAKGESLKAIVPMGQVAGLVDNNSKIQSVVIEMHKGSFTPASMDLSDDLMLDFNTKVKAYFAANPVRYLINSLDLTSISALPALTPSQFVFKSLMPKTGRPCLQLYITTDRRAALNYSQAQLNNIDDPIPEGSECSLMISSKVMFGSVLPSSLGNKGWTLAGVQPSTDTAWSGKFTAGSVSGTVDLSSLTERTSTGSRGGTTTSTRTVSIPGGNNVVWSIDGMTLAVESSGALKLGMVKAMSQKFNVHRCSQFCGFWCNDETCTDTEYATSVNVTMGATLPVRVVGTGRDQQIKIDVTGNSVTLDGHMSGGGPCNCDDLQALFNQQLRGQIPGKVASQLGVSFEPISLFALKNLLFPAKNYINLTGAYIPGDALIIGIFTKGQ